MKPPNKARRPEASGSGAVNENICAQHSPHLVTADLCVRCKATKKLCGLSFCPLLSKIKAQSSMSKSIGLDMFGPSNELFVGSAFYPDVYAGPLVSAVSAESQTNAAETRTQSIESPRDLYGKSYEEIIRNFSAILRGKQKTTVTRRVSDEMQEVSISIRAVDVEVKFSKVPKFDMQFSSVLQPMGASAPLREFHQAENPKIPGKVDSVIGEGLKATEALCELSNAGFDNYYLSRILSSGALGKKENRKLVPTRWGITATDDMLGKQILGEVREFPEQNEFLLFHNEFLHNRFFVLLLPGAWEFENFESWAPESVWAKGATDTITTEEYEPHEGRTTYADKQVGAYYAVRLAVAEYLNKIRRQARVVVIREIGEGYIVPVGVWEVRENVRHALLSAPERFGSLSKLFTALSSSIRVPLSRYQSMSKIMRQTRLGDFF
ncbi:TPA: hypothetical protein HA238_04775 [Candidatus Micrarchaeota archaeon]|nr:hypothetical protein [Candidatus Micrarchaeota archaeon]